MDNKLNSNENNNTNNTNENLNLNENNNNNTNNTNNLNSNNNTNNNTNNLNSNSNNNTIDNQNTKVKNKKTNKNVSFFKRNNPISNNIFLITISIFVILFILLIVLFSEGFRVKRVISNFEKYNVFQTISNYNYKEKGDNILGNHYIASSYNSCNVKKPVLSYMNCDNILKGILQSGARFIEFKIFNDKFGVKNIEPIVNNGFEVGEWKLCFNSVNFEDVCKVIKEHAFKVNKKISDGNIEGVPNPNDPLFISLDLKTRNNVGTLNILTRHITNYLKDYLLNPKYNYNNDINLVKMQMKNLKKKIVLLCSSGYQGSDLESIINGSWEEGGNINRVYWEDLDKLGKDDREKEKEKIKKILTIVTPDPDLDLVGKLKVFGKQNYNTELAFSLGCHFVSVYYQSMNNITPYITRFRKKSIILKPDTLHNNYKPINDEIEEDNEDDNKNFNYSEYKKKLQEAAELLKNLDID